LPMGRDNPAVFNKHLTLGWLPMLWTKNQIFLNVGPERYTVPEDSSISSYFAMDPSYRLKKGVHAAKRLAPTDLIWIYQGSPEFISLELHRRAELLKKRGQASGNLGRPCR